MLSYERRQKIAEILKTQGLVKVEELAAAFDISPSTIRRDLDKLAAGGGIRRTYGGAYLEDSRAEEPPIILREREHAQAKEKIGKKAAELVKSGMTVILDASSTVGAMVPFLSRVDGLTVVTNGVKTASRLNSCANIRTYCTGGLMRKHNLSLVGMETCRVLEEINADTLFISCRGFGIEKGVTEASDEETQVKRCMLRAASQTVLLADSSKLGQVMMHKICDIGSIDILITDAKLPEALEEQCRRQGVRVLYA